MKILHTSDWHIGRTLHGADLSAAHDLFFQDLEQIIKAEEVSVLLVSGDILDRAVPSTQSLLQLERALESLSHLCPVVIAPGNHDSAARLGFLSSQLRDRVQIIARDNRVGRAVEVTDKNETVLLYPLPYLDPDMWREVLADELGSVLPPAEDEGEGDQLLRLPRSHEAVMAAALRRVGRDLDERNISAQDEQRPPVIVMAHAFITGGAASDSERDISVGGVDSIPAAVMLSLGNPTGLPDLRLSYVALGHLHRPQIVADQPKLRYCGSPIAFSFSEAGQKKSVLLLETDGPSISAREVELSVWREIYRLSGAMNEVMSHQNDPQIRDAFVEVTVTDTVRPESFHQRIKASYPHALVIRHLAERPALPSHAPASTQATRVQDVLVSFLADMKGSDPTEGEVKVLLDAYDSVRSERNSG
ncbi:exonuclease SbcCD subunit D [Boudabousia marimammalium]|uniref:Nuclease SbcCD subunit D n=1 Tax=Boudabousia marimammalium TaxID=156892 RepID=A0A1Q5PS13_9ACTO|nr:exonuclease SbcCD subunit D [Boudabousia marimammalium]OKL50374.1 hypothetical protein BM477_01995 [Boudabousia marimammalium]